MLQDLGDRLVMRYPTDADTDALCAFNAEMHGAPGPPDERIGVWTRDIMAGTHPTSRQTDFTVIEDTRTGKIISSLNLISQTWTYGGIPFGVGQVEAVATHPDYRRKGLVRKQFELVHQWSRARGELVQVVSGILWYYRQFGYEYALEHDGGRGGYLATVPTLTADAEEPYRVRPATDTDLALIARLDEAARARYLVTASRDAALWRYELDGRSESNLARRGLRIIESAAGKPVGYLTHAEHLNGPWLVAQAIELDAGISWLAVMPSVLRYLAEAGKAYQAGEGQTSFGGYMFLLGTDHPVYRAIPDRLTVERPSYAWYVRVPDLPALITRIAPVLEARLAASVAVGYTGELKLCFYRDGLRLRFTDGKVSAEPWPEAHDQDADALFPEQTFLQVLFGYRSMEELRHAFPDVSARNERSKVLLEALFPKQASLVWQIS